VQKDVKGAGKFLILTPILVKKLRNRSIFASQSVSSYVKDLPISILRVPRKILYLKFDEKEDPALQLEKPCFSASSSFHLEVGENSLCWVVTQRVMVIPY